MSGKDGSGKCEEVSSKTNLKLLKYYISALLLVFCAQCEGKKLGKDAGEEDDGPLSQRDLGSETLSCSWVVAPIGEEESNVTIDGIAFDLVRNIYITGEFGGRITGQGKVKFGSYTVNALSTNEDIYLAKVSRAGKFIWVVDVRDDGDESSTGDIGTDGAGNSYINVLFSSAISLGRTTLTSATYTSENLVARSNPSGEFLWAVSTRTDCGIYICKGTNGGGRIFVDQNSNSYITGRFRYNTLFGSHTLAVKKEGLLDTYLAKVDQSGKFIWAISSGSEVEDEGEDVEVDENGNSYITGVYIGGAFSFGSLSLDSKPSACYIYVVKVDPSGKPLWVVGGGGGESEYTITEATSIALDGKSNSYIAGHFIDSEKAVFGTSVLKKNSTSTYPFISPFLSKISSDGKYLWAISIEGYLQRSFKNAVTVDKNGYGYITGIYEKKAIFGSITLIGKKDSYDIFIAKVSPNGRFLRAWSIGGDGDESEAGVKLDHEGNLYLTGTFENTFKCGFSTIKGTKKTPFLAMIPKSQIEHFK